MKQIGISQADMRSGCLRRMRRGRVDQVAGAHVLLPFAAQTRSGLSSLVQSIQSPTHDPLTTCVLRACAFELAAACRWYRALLWCLHASRMLPPLAA